MYNENSVIKKRTVPKTQAISFVDVTTNGTRSTQKQDVLFIIENSQRPLSLREIAKTANIEISACCRCLADLQQNFPPLVKVTHVDKSPLTGRKVQFYAGSAWQNPKPGTPLQIPFKNQNQ